MFLADCTLSTERSDVFVSMLGAAIPGRVQGTAPGVVAGPRTHHGAMRHAVHPDGRVVAVQPERPSQPPRTAGASLFPEAVFVYGTLMRGEEREEPLRDLLAGVVPETSAVDGQLVHLGAWPGLLAAPGRVAGELYSVGTAARMASVLSVLDPIEDFVGYAVVPTEYVRVVVSVRTQRGPRWAWAYRYVGPVTRAQPIPTGRWRDAPRRLPWWRDD